MTQVRKIFEKYGYEIFLILLAIFSFLVFRRVGNAAGLNGVLTMDDLCSVQFSTMGNNILEKMKGIVANDPTNVPLFYFALYIWIELFGYSANVMRILPEIMGAITVILIGLIGKELKNKRAGVITAVVAATSLPLIYGSFQIRAYSMLMLFAALTFYFWIKRKEGKKSIILLAVAMLLMSYTHFLGALVSAAFCSYDIFSILRKKEKKAVLWSYVIYGLLFVPYLVIAYISAMNLWETFWPPVPGVKDYFNFLGRLIPVGTVGIWLFGIVFFVYLFQWIRKKDLKNEIFGSYWIIFAVLTVAFVYSKFINPTSSIWVYRYFLVLFPFTVAIVGYAMELVLEWIEKHIKIEPIVISAILAFLACRYTYTNIVYAEEHPEAVVVNGADYETLTNLILTTEGVMEEDTLVFFSYPTLYFDGWTTYASEGGQKELPNLYCDAEQFATYDLGEYQVVYVVRIVGDMTDENKKHVEKDFTLEETIEDDIYFIDKYVRD